MLHRYEQLARALAGQMECPENEARHVARDVLMALINVSAQFFESVIQTHQQFEVVGF